MTNTLNDVIKVCEEEEYGLQVNPENRNQPIEFLERQLNDHPEYDLNKRTPKAKKTPFRYFNLMRSNLLLFYYLIGETPIIAGTKEHEVERRIGWYSQGDERGDGSIVEEWELKPKKERKKDLYLLRYSQIAGAASGNLPPLERSQRKALKQTDEKLLSLYVFFSNSHAKYEGSWQNWSSIIDELGQDKAVVEYFGQKITYEIVKKCKPPKSLVMADTGEK